MARIANIALAQALSDGIVKPANKLKAKRKLSVEPVTPVNEVTALPGGEALQRVEKKAFEHIQHQYDKDAKIQKQSCMKAAASAYNPPFGEDPDVIADKVIQIAKKLFQWVNSD
jgi:hypothetical protein